MSSISADEDSGDAKDNSSTEANVQKGISFICRNQKTAYIRLSYSSKRNRYLEALFDSSFETTHSHIVKIDSFDSDVIQSVLDYISIGCIMFDKNIDITPRYLQKIYSACRYFMTEFFPEIIDFSDIHVNEPVINQTTIYGKLKNDNIFAKTFSSCFFSKVEFRLHDELESVKFKYCFFKNCVMRNISFDEECLFSNCKFENCDFSETMLTGFINSNFIDCDMCKTQYGCNSTLNGNTFTNCILRGFCQWTSIKTPIMRTGNAFYSCDLTGSVLKGFVNSKEIDCILTFATFDNRNIEKNVNGFHLSSKCKSLNVFN
jgi:hypothetical protein